MDLMDSYLPCASEKQPVRPRVKDDSSQGAELSEVEERDDSVVNQDVTADHTPINDQSQKGEESVMMFEEFSTKPEVCLFKEISSGVV